MEIDPDYWWSHQAFGLSYERKKQYSEAIAALERARLADPNPTILGYLGYVYASAGRKTEAQRTLDEMEELSTRRYVSPYHPPCIYAGLGPGTKPSSTWNGRLKKGPHS
jgi:tetratricopeptide (TPR) repeat protein